MVAIFSQSAVSFETPLTVFESVPIQYNIRQLQVSNCKQDHSYNNKKERKKETMIRQGRIVKCVLTGGPCGGKSSAAEIIKREALKAGYRCLFIPEVYTIVVANGVEYPKEEDEEELLDFHKVMLKMQLQMEDSFTEFAEQYSAKGENVLILLDRGFIDNKSYVPTQLWKMVLNHFRYSSDEAVMNRYDIVLHLKSVAVDARHYYSIEGHTTRLETADEAQKLDELLSEAWEPHPQHFSIDNSMITTATETTHTQEESFNWKMKRVWETLEPFLTLYSTKN